MSEAQCRWCATSPRLRLSIPSTSYIHAVMTSAGKYYGTWAGTRIGTSFCLSCLWFTEEKKKSTFTLSTDLFYDQL